MPAPPSHPQVTGNTAYTEPENRVFYPALDGLRAVAFLMIFAEHYFHVPWGWTGVYLFFALSGFLITGILWDSRNDPHRVRNFYVRRTLRIFPLFYGVLLVLLLTQPLFNWNWNWSWWVWPAYMGNNSRWWTQNMPLVLAQLTGSWHPKHAVLYLGHFWSLCLEEQFYLFSPWVIFYVRSRRLLLWISLASLPVITALRWFAAAHLPRVWAEDRATIFHLDTLLAGAFLALVLRGPAAASLLRYGRRLAWMMPLALALWLLYSPSHRPWSSDFIYPTSTLFTLDLLPIEIMSAWLILLAIGRGSIVYYVLNAPPLRWLGRLTYGAYIFHDLAHAEFLFIGGRLLPAHPVFAGSSIAFITTIALAWLSFRFFESPFLDLKDRWTVRRDPSEAGRPSSI